MENKPIKSGVILKPIVKTDCRFGAFGDNEIKVQDGNWNPYNPSNEKQKRGYESFKCTNYGSTSSVEMLFTRKIKLKLISPDNLQWLHDKGYFDDNGNINFSDDFDALVSNTDPTWGNTLKAPADAKHKFGLIPERMLPWVEDKEWSFNKKRITPEMYVLGLEFLKRFPINYEFVQREDFAEALKVSPLAGALYAWDGVKDGVYQEIDRNINHAIVIIKPPTYWNIFDSYDPFIKKLVDNYTFYDYAIRYIVGENTDVPDQSVKEGMYKLLRDPKNPKEVFAFNQSMTVKRHVANKSTLLEGAKQFDQYWVWNEIRPIVVATPKEFAGATEMAEILLLIPDSKVETPAAGFNLLEWFLGLFKKKKRTK